MGMKEAGVVMDVDRFPTSTVPPAASGLVKLVLVGGKTAKRFSSEGGGDDGNEAHYYTHQHQQPQSRLCFLLLCNQSFQIDAVGPGDVVGDDVDAVGVVVVDAVVIVVVAVGAGFGGIGDGVGDVVDGFEKEEEG